MFDFHMHSSISFDSDALPEAMCRQATAVGLQELCFTDHYDWNNLPGVTSNLFSPADYHHAYHSLVYPGVTIRRGVELGLTPDNRPHLEALLSTEPFDFVIGSVHYIGGLDPYDAEFWENRSREAALWQYFEEILHCVQVHDQFDVLGHLTYACKYAPHPEIPLSLNPFQELTDEIMRVLIAKGKGIEINTSGLDRIGTVLPDPRYLRRFRELGGELVTVGSDAHAPTQVGQHIPVALELARDIFGYVCTFAHRQPIFHQL